MEGNVHLIPSSQRKPTTGVNSIFTKAPTTVSLEKLTYSENTKSVFMPDTTAATTASASSANTTMTTSTNLLGTGTTASGPKDSPSGKAKDFKKTGPLSAAVEEVSDSSFDNNSNLSESLTEVLFTPTQCLFCSSQSSDLQSNLSHMQQNHGLFIPHTLFDVHDGVSKVLAVETETLLRYMHLVIFGDLECLFCHKQRRSVLAVQQHMMSRGHCRMNLDGGSDREFLDFYEEEDDNEDEDDDSGAESNASVGKGMHDGNTLRLSSGKMLSHRSAAVPPRTNRQPLAAPKNRPRGGPAGLLLESMVSDPSDNTTTDHHPPTICSSTPSSALTRTEKRALTHQTGALAVALSQMSTRDRASLAHLSRAEQRAMVITRYRQQESGNNTERRQRSKNYDASGIENK